MALEIEKSVTLTGNSRIGDIAVVNLNANVTTESAGNTNINQTILNNALYKENTKVCRADVIAFQEEIWKIEDNLTTDE